jgi:hypothetical protein
MSTYAFAALFLAAAILLAVQHSYWRGRLDTQVRITWDALRECTKAQNQLEAIRVRNGERRLLAEIDGFRGDFENVVSLDERRAR